MRVAICMAISGCVDVWECECIRRLIVDLYNNLFIDVRVFDILIRRVNDMVEDIEYSESCAADIADMEARGILK